MAANKTHRWLIALVLLHLVVTIAHGLVHGSAGVGLSPAALAFVIAVIQIGPLAGLWRMRYDIRSGAAIVAIAMSGSLVFGFINHFVIPGADRIDHVAASSQLSFGVTAVLLVVLEAAGAVTGFVCAGVRRRFA